MTTPQFTPSQDLPTRAVSRLLPTLTGPVSTSIALVGGDALTPIEEVALDIINGLELGATGASGPHLDRWGAVVAEGRNSRSDRAYRAAISTRLLIYRSSGQVDELRLILQRLAGAPSPPVSFETQGAVHFEVSRETVAELTTAERASIRADLESAAAAGIRIDPIVDVRSASFRFDDGPGFDTGQLAASF
jgi:hypothetical protein